jgi:hypothetical protein
VPTTCLMQRMEIPGRAWIESGGPWQSESGLVQHVQVPTGCNGHSTKPGQLRLKSARSADRSGGGFLSLAECLCGHLDQGARAGRREPQPKWWQTPCVEADEPDDRVAGRASLLPEERAAGSAEPETQAEAILAESDDRASDREAAPDGFVEQRTSDEATEPT